MKRFVALILSALMLFTLVPEYAFATTELGEVVVYAEADLQTITYELDEESTDNSTDELKELENILQEFDVANEDEAGIIYDEAIDEVDTIYGETIGETFDDEIIEKSIVSTMERLLHGASPPAAIQDIFPYGSNRHLARAVAEALGGSWQITDVVTQADLDSITHLNIRSGLNYVERLNGVQYLRNLNTLTAEATAVWQRGFWCTNFYILTQLPNLQVFRWERGAWLLSHDILNALTPLSELLSLREFYFRNTNHRDGLILDISPLASLPNLVSLTLRISNYIALFRPFDTRNLRYLTLSYHCNGLSLEYLRNLTNLRELSLNIWNRNTNPIDLTPLIALTNLQELYLTVGGGGVVALNPLNRLSNLRGLTIGSQVADLSPLSNMNRLERLDLSSTRISNLPTWTNLPNLRELDLSNNYIGCISPLSGLTSLQGLDLSNNQIGCISPLSGLTSLQILDLNNNYIQDSKPLESLINLRTLRLANRAGGSNRVRNNTISDIAPLAALTNLRVLDLYCVKSVSSGIDGGNQVFNLSPLAGLTSLEFLYLSGNLISNVAPLAGLTNMESLYLSANQISSVAPLSNMMRLRTLDLNHNAIFDISPLYSLVNHTYLEILRLNDQFAERPAVNWNNPLTIPNIIRDENGDGDTVHMSIGVAPSNAWNQHIQNINPPQITSDNILLYHVDTSVESVYLFFQHRIPNRFSGTGNGAFSGTVRMPVHVDMDDIAEINFDGGAANFLNRLLFTLGSTIGLSNVPTPRGVGNLTFTGWRYCNQADDTTNLTNAEVAAHVVTGPITFTAQWSPPQPITFNLNGGNINGNTANIVHTRPHGSHIGTNNVPIPSLENATFDGRRYYGQAEGAPNLSNMQVAAHTVMGPVTFIAQWVPSITTHASLPSGAVSYPYSATLAAIGAAPIYWSVYSGELPEGLSLNSDTGRIAGIPTQAGEFTFTIKAQNEQGYDTRTFTIIIAYTPTSPTIITETLPARPIGVPYNATLSASGTTPIIWEVESGDLPNGLTLSDDGVISGTHTELGTFNFTIKAENMAGYCSKPFYIEITSDIVGITLNRDITILQVGDDDTLIATVTPETVFNNAVIWSSDNEDIVTVDADGNITALRQGYARITATTVIGDHEAYSYVFVILSVTGVTLDSDEIEFNLRSNSGRPNVGRTMTITATVAPEDATDAEVRWESSDTSVVTVTPLHGHGIRAEMFQEQTLMYNRQ